MIRQDTLWKGIIESLTDDFLRFFFPQYAHTIDFAVPFQFLNAELQQIMPDNATPIRHADQLIRVATLAGESLAFLVHVEVQGYDDPHFAERMYIYAYRILDRFNLPVCPLAIYTGSNRRFHPNHYEVKFMGSSLRYTFNTYVLLDHPFEDLALDSNPFAAVMAAAWPGLLRKPSDEALFDQKITLVRQLLQRKIDPSKIRSIISFIKFYRHFTRKDFQRNFDQELIVITQSDTNMTIEEAIIHEIREQGIEQGIELGIEKGIEQGIEKGQRTMLLTIVQKQKRKGASPLQVAELLELPLELVQDLWDQSTDLADL